MILRKPYQVIIKNPAADPNVVFARMNPYDIAAIAWATNRPELLREIKNYRADELLKAARRLAFDAKLDLNSAGITVFYENNHPR